MLGFYILGWPGDDDLPCSWQADEADARSVAAVLGIPFHTVNLTDEYRQQVFEPFLADYRRGRTPNPDVLCNRRVKFKALWQFVRQFEPDYLATGHYALKGEIKSQNTKTRKESAIFKAVDANKDQTYFLWGIEPTILEKVIFPLGELTKPFVRELAKKYKLPTATKKDSQGICFVGQLKVGEYLTSHLPTRPGPVVLTDGREIALHPGIWFQTIGQRLGVSQLNWTGDRPPLYLVAKDITGNRLIVGHDADCFAQEFRAEGANWLSQSLPPAKGRFECLVKIRYRQEDVKGVVEVNAGGVLVQLARPVRAITPGQSVVFYGFDGQLLGGATITQVQRQTELIDALQSSKSASFNPELSPKPSAIR